MAKLSQENLDFILKHKIPLEDVFDATGLRRKEYEKIMEENGYRLAYGVTPCQEFGHTLRFKKGHCAICNPMSLSYSKRFREEGYVYIVISSSTKLIKIGSSKDYKNRNNNLNAEKYGGIDDWQLLAYSFQKQRGLVENAIQSHFINYQVQREYFKGGQKVTTREIFDIDLKILLDTIKKLGYLFEFPNQILMKKFLANDKTTNNINTAEQLVQEQKRLTEEKAQAEKLAQEQKRLAEEKARAEKIAQEQKRLAEEKARAEKLAQEQKRLAEEKAHAEKLVQEQKRLAEEKARAEKLSQEQKRLAEEKAQAEKLVQEQKRLAEEKARAEKLAQEQKRLAEEKAHAEKLVQEQKRLAEEKARAEKLAQEQKRLAEEKAKDEKTFQKQKNPFHIERINTGILEERLARKQAQEEAELQIKQAKLKKERARKKAENRQLAIEAQRERQRQAIQQRLAEEKAKAEKFAQEQKRLAEEQAQAEKLAQEQKRLAEERVQAEKLDQEQKRLAEEKARAEKLAQEQQQKALEWEKIILAEKLEKQKMIDSWEKSKQEYQNDEDDVEYMSISEYLKDKIKLVLHILGKSVLGLIGLGVFLGGLIWFVVNFIVTPYLLIKTIYTAIINFFS